MAASASAVSRLLSAGGISKSRALRARGGSTEGYWTEQRGAAVFVSYSVRWSVGVQQRIDRDRRAMSQAAAILRDKGYTVAAETNPDGTVALTVTKEN